MLKKHISQINIKLLENKNILIFNTRNKHSVNLKKWMGLNTVETWKE